MKNKLAFDFCTTHKVGLKQYETFCKSKESYTILFVEFKGGSSEELNTPKSIRSIENSLKCPASLLCGIAEKKSKNEYDL